MSALQAPVLRGRSVTPPAAAHAGPWARVLCALALGYQKKIQRLTESVAVRDRTSREAVLEPDVHFFRVSRSEPRRLAIGPRCP
jgi:hypothetical protein